MDRKSSLIHDSKTYFSSDVEGPKKYEGATLIFSSLSRGNSFLAIVGVIQLTGLRTLNLVPEVIDAELQF